MVQKILGKMDIAQTIMISFSGNNKKRNRPPENNGNAFSWMGESQSLRPEGMDPKNLEFFGAILGPGGLKRKRAYRKIL